MVNIEKHNPHWKEGFFYGFETTRSIFEKLVSNLDNRQIISISGLRRTGKTILLKQLINHLIREKKDRMSIMYFSFDEEQPKIDELIKEFEKLSNLDKTKTKIYCFFDEIQKLDDWQNQIKYYYDNFNIKFFISGSSSMFIKKKIRESLAGRSFDFFLPPLSFKEFLIFRGKQELIEKPALFENEIKKYFELYIKRQFVEIVNENPEFIAEYAKSVLEKVVYIDIPKVFPIEHEELLLRLLGIIASNPGMIVEYESLSKELGINRATLSNYFFYLEEAFLIKKLYNFSKNRLTSEKKSKKVYLSCLSFFQHFNEKVEESKIIENLFAIELNAKFFWRTPFKDEVDFIIEKDNIFIPIEVKYKNIVSDKDIKILIKFCTKFNSNNCIVITKNDEKRKIFKKGKKKIKVDFIPAWKFALSLP